MSDDNKPTQNNIDQSATHKTTEGLSELPTDGVCVGHLIDHTTQNGLPVSSSIARRFLDVNSSTPRTAVARRLIRHLTLVIIRELAKLEKAFIDSRFYRVIVAIRPSLLPSSSAYPFILSIVLGIIQTKRLWKWQRPLLIQLAVTMGPTLSTIQLLGRLNTAQDVPGEELKELTRWTAYWLIYALVVNFEKVNIWTPAPAQPSPTVLPPIIYPALVSEQSSRSSRSRLLRVSYTFIQRISHILQQSLSRYGGAPSRSAIDLRSAFPQTSLSKPRLGITEGRRSIKLLPDYYFGSNSAVYLIFKVLFLRWCSGPRTRGSEKIWSQLVAPIIESMSSVSKAKTSCPGIRRKVVKVIITEEEHPVISDKNSMSIHSPQSKQDHPFEFISPHIEPSQGESIGYQAAVPIRRSRSDPIPNPANSYTPEPFDLSPSKVHDHAPSFIKKTAFHNDFRTPENAWDSSSLVAL